MIFSISVILRSILALKYAEPNVWYDELLHWKMGEAIIEEGNISFRGLISSRSSILYSVLISIAHIMPDNFTSQNLAQIMNASIMSSAIFPIYLLVKEVSDNKR